jgi:uncharacterized phage-like protein YoqJ
MIVGWTGHRPDLFHDPQAASQSVVALARELVDAGRVQRFVVGGQRGVDTWATQAAIDLGVPFTVVLPLEVAEFTRDWSNEDRARLQEHLARAERVRSVGGQAEQAYRERNRLLATSSDLLVAVWTGKLGGGTAETIDFARQLGSRVREIRLAPSPAAGFAAGRGI